MPHLDDSLVKAAAAMSPESVLRKLAWVATTNKQPLVVIRLLGGHVLRGGLVKIAEERGSEYVLLADRDAGTLEYVPLSGVIGIAVENPAAFQDLLTGGTMPLPQAGEPVTRLALQREFAPGSEFPVDVDWAMFEGSGPEIGNLATLLRALRDAAAEVRADELGRQAWARVGTLRAEHRAGALLAVARIADGLVVRTDLTAALPRELRPQLVTEISALL